MSGPRSSRAGMHAGTMSTAAFGKALAASRRALALDPDA